MLVHEQEAPCKRETSPPPTDDPQVFHSLGDVAKSVTKRAILRGYAHGVLSVGAAQALIDALDLRRA